MRYFCLFMLLLIAACSNNDTIVRPPNYREPTREELRKAMRYHGVFFAEQDDDREWYFVRNGKRCRLFAHLENREQ